MNVQTHPEVAPLDPLVGLTLLPDPPAVSFARCAVSDEASVTIFCFVNSFTILYIVLLFLVHRKINNQLCQYLSCVLQSDSKRCKTNKQTNCFIVYLFYIFCSCFV